MMAAASHAACCSGLASGWCTLGVSVLMGTVAMLWALVIDCDADRVGAVALTL